MNVAKCLLLVVGIVVFVDAQEDFHSFTASVMEIQEYCNEKENVTMEFEFSAEVLHEADNHEWKCMLECVASELGIVSRMIFMGYFHLILSFSSVITDSTAAASTK
jgi:hypothetical protein